MIFGLPWFKENNPQIVWKTGRVQLPKADLDTTFLYLAKDERRRKEIKEEGNEFRKELSQRSSSKKNIPLNKRTVQFNDKIETRTKSEPISLNWRKRQQNKEKSPITGNPLTRRTEQTTKQSDELNWRSQKWEKPIQEVESPSIVPKTEMSIELENDDEQNQRSRLKELITQRLEAQSIALAMH